MRRPALLLLSVTLLVQTGCNSMYYATMETFGVEKRDILVDRVEDARDAQEDAKEQFKTTLERFKELTGADGGELEDVYSDLASELSRSETRAQEVHDRVDAIEDVAQDLFEEWLDEAEEFQSDSMRNASLDMLSDTQDRYGELMLAMRKAEKQMTPILQDFRDSVTMLKHQLNAKYIASLQNTVLSIESNVADLIADMESSIAEANRFIDGQTQ